MNRYTVWKDWLAQVTIGLSDAAHIDERVAQWTSAIVKRLDGSDSRRVRQSPDPEGTHDIVIELFKATATLKDSPERRAGVNAMLQVAGTLLASLAQPSWPASATPTLKRWLDTVGYGNVDDVQLDNSLVPIMQLVVRLHAEESDADTRADLEVAGLNFFAVRAKARMSLLELAAMLPHEAWFVHAAWAMVENQSFDATEVDKLVRSAIRHAGSQGWDIDTAHLLRRLGERESVHSLAFLQATFGGESESTLIQPGGSIGIVNATGVYDGQFRSAGFSGRRDLSKGRSWFRLVPSTTAEVFGTLAGRVVKFEPTVNLSELSDSVAQDASLTGYGKPRHGRAFRRHHGARPT